MTDPLHLPLDEDEFLFEPPLVDALSFDPDHHGYVISFIPDDAMSRAETESVLVPEASSDGRLIKAWLEKFAELLAISAPLERFVYSGDGDFTFHFQDKTTARLANVSVQGIAIQIFDGLKWMGHLAAARWAPE